MIIRLYVVAFVSISCFSLAFSQNSDSDTLPGLNKTLNCKNCAPPVSSKGQKWITTEKKLKNLISFASRKILRYLDPEDVSKISPKCFSSIMKITIGLKQLKMWAFRFIDAMGKIPEGMVRGTFSALGDFDECLEINVTDSFQGQSCILEITPPLPKVMPVIGIVDHVPELETHFAADTLFGGIDSLLKPHYEIFKLRIAICVPSTCTDGDVKFIAEKALEVTNILVGWDVDVPVCQVKSDMKIEKWDDYTSVIIIGLLILMVICGTLIDVTMTKCTKSGKGNSRTFIRILLCFSMYRNTEKLLKQNESSDSILIFNGMKVVTMLWVILNHTYAFAPREFYHGALFVQDVGKSFAFQPVLNGFSTVDTFFFIGGTLLMYSWMNAKEQNISIFMYIFKRYWRLTPPMMLIIAFELLIDKVGSGPVWDMVYRPFVTNCHERWWTNLIHINNFYGYDDSCVGWTWYVASDMQLYIISLAVLLTIKKKPKVSLGILVGLSVTSIAAIVFNQFYYDLPPQLTITNARTTGDMYYYVKYNYYRPHMHAIVYFIGLAVGYILHYKSKIHISRKMNIVGWLASLTAGMTVVYSGYIWYNVVPDPSTAVAAICNVASKVLWSLSLGWVTISCCTGNGGFIARLLSWSALTTLAKLTYVTYLVHPIIQVAYYGSMRVPFQADHRTFVTLYLSFVTGSFMAAYFLSMLFEAPFMQLEKIIFVRNKVTSNFTRDIEKNSKSNGERCDFSNKYVISN